MKALAWVIEIKFKDYNYANYFYRGDGMVGATAFDFATIYLERENLETDLKEANSQWGREAAIVPVYVDVTNIINYRLEKLKIEFANKENYLKQFFRN